jgi:hypothetical protein
MDNVLQYLFENAAKAFSDHGWEIRLRPAVFGDDIEITLRVVPNRYPDDQIWEHVWHGNQLRSGIWKMQFDNGIRTIKEKIDGSVRA